MLHYAKYCPFYGDSMAIPLVSGIGDWGSPGVLIYIIVAIFSLILWRIAQASPRLFIAYLLVPYFPDNLFWSVVFNYIKTMGFMWLVLLVAGVFLMPRWIPSVTNNVQPNTPKLLKTGSYSGIKPDTR
jgi:hypothetical protein